MVLDVKEFSVSFIPLIERIPYGAGYAQSHFLSVRIPYKIVINLPAVLWIRNELVCN